MNTDHLRRRVDRLEADQDTVTASAIVIYEAGESEGDRLARIPAGAETVIFLPNNHRDDRPKAP